MASTKTNPYGSGRRSNTLSVADAAYLAGLIDGEGTIGMAWRKPGSRAGRFQFHVVVNMTERDVLAWVAETTGLGNVTGPYARRGNWHGFFRWAVQSAGAISVLEQIEPYLRVKCANARLAIRTHAEILANTERGRDIEWLEMVRDVFHEMNARGADSDARKRWAERGLSGYDRGFRRETPIIGCAAN